MCGALPTKLLQVAGGLPFMTEIISLAMENISSTELQYVRQIFGHFFSPTFSLLKRQKRAAVKHRFQLYFLS